MKTPMQAKGDHAQEGLWWQGPDQMGMGTAWSERSLLSEAVARYHGLGGQTGVCFIVLEAYSRRQYLVWVTTLTHWLG